MLVSIYAISRYRDPTVSATDNIPFFADPIPSSSPPCELRLCILRRLFQLCFLHLTSQSPKCPASLQDKTSILHARVEALGTHAHQGQTLYDAATLSLAAMVAPMEIWRQPASILLTLASFLTSNVRLVADGILVGRRRRHSWAAASLVHARLDVR